MVGRVTPPKRVTSPAWSPTPPCKQALSQLGQPTYEMTPGSNVSQKCKVRNFFHGFSGSEDRGKHRNGE